MRQGSTTKFATGKRGNWFVTLRNGERLPCLMDLCWMGGTLYHEDYFYNPDKRKQAEFIAAVRAGRVVMAKYEKEPGKPYKRVGYIEGCVFKVAEVSNVDGHGLSCRIVGSEIV